MSVLCACGEFLCFCWRNTSSSTLYIFFFSVFFYCWVLRVLYILDSTFIWFINIFSHLVGHLVSFLKISFDAQLEWLWNQFSLWDFGALEKVEPTTTTTPYRAWVACISVKLFLQRNYFSYFLSLPPTQLKETNGPLANVSWKTLLARNTC